MELHTTSLLGFHYLFVEAAFMCFRIRLSCSFFGSEYAWLTRDSIPISSFRHISYVPAIFVIVVRWRIYEIAMRSSPVSKRRAAVSRMLGCLRCGLVLCFSETRDLLFPGTKSESMMQ